MRKTIHKKKLRRFGFFYKVMNKISIFLTKFQKKLKHTQKPFQFLETQSILFLLDNENDIKNDAVQFLIKEWNIKEKYFFIFKEGENTGIDTTYFFDEKKLDFWAKWKDIHLKDIVEKKFDVLIDFSIKNDDFFKYVTQLCKANFVISYRDNLKPDLQINLQHFNQETYAKEIIRIIKLYI